MKSLTTIALALFLSHSVFSQNMTVVSDSSSTQKQEAPKKKKEKQPYTGKRTFIGGGLGLGFGRDYGFFNGSVMLGYNITKSLQAAGKVTYWYNWGNFYDPRGGKHDYGNSIYAFSVPVRYVIWKGIFLHAEPEYMNLPEYSWAFDARSPTGYDLEEYRVDAFNFYVGGGAYLHFIGNSGPFFQVLWNLNETENSFYSNPYWQVGYAVGF